VDEAQLIRRFERIEQQIRLLSERLGVECPTFASDRPHADANAAAVAAPEESGVPAEVVELARAGKSTQAISTFRKLTGATLLEAKRVVDAL
jgi:ribosomal protein L7/L12